MAAKIKLRAEREAGKLLLTQGVTPPSHLGPVPATLLALVRRFDEGIGQGDMLIVDDPCDGAASGFAGVSPCV